MLLLLTILWPALVASLVLGSAIGWHFGPPRGRLSTAIGLGLGVAAMALGGLAFTGVVPGRPGFWVESAALNLAAYLIGAGAGALAKIAGRRPTARGTSGVPSTSKIASSGARGAGRPPAHRAPR